MPGFSFQDQKVKVVEADIEKLLAEFRNRLEDFAKNETLAKHLVDIYKRHDNEAIQAVDHRMVSN